MKVPKESEFYAVGTGKTPPESLALYLSNTQCQGHAWFTVTAYELIPGEEPEIYIHAGSMPYILRFAEVAGGVEHFDESPPSILFRALCKREVEWIKVGGPLLSILLAAAPAASSDE